MAVSETVIPGRAVIPEVRSVKDSGGACDQVTLTSALGGTSSGNKVTSNATSKGSGGWKALAIKHNQRQFKKVVTTSNVPAE